MASSFDRVYGGGSPASANTSFARMGIGLQQPGSDLKTSDGLLMLAQQQGGSIAQTANELAHPEVGILSTIGTGLKNAFRGFIDVISMPSQVVAGIISPNITVGEAIEKNISPSDVLFGDPKKDASIYEKTGSFLVRTATDILLDPLTYVTLGAGAGTKISLGEKAAKTLGKEVLDPVTLSKSGQEVYKYLKGIERQIAGKTAVDIIKTGDAAMDLGAKELTELLKVTIDSPLRPDFAKRALTNILEKSPQMTGTLLDKGGIKVFGKSILSGQRIASTMKLVPGMTQLDLITQQPRRAMGALFDPTIVKGADGVYERLPMEYVDLQQKWKDMSLAFGEGKIQKLDDIVKQFSLSTDEARFLTSAIEYQRLPSDSRLAGAYKAVLGFNEDQWDELVKAGLVSRGSRMESHIPHVLVKNRTQSVAWKMPPSTKTGAQEMRLGAKFIDDAGNAIEGNAKNLGLTAVKGEPNIFTNTAGQRFTREVAPLQDVSEQAFKELEGTLLKNPKAATAMLNSMRKSGFEMFDDNAVTALAARSFKNTKAISMKYFLSDLAQSFGEDAVIANPAFRRIASKSVDDASEEFLSLFGKEGELVFHPAIAQHVENFVGSVINDDATMDFLKAYDSLQNAWKSTVTSIWPAFHGRNAISNVLQNYLDLGVGALDPKIHAMSGDLIRVDRQLSKLQRAAAGAGDDAVKASQEAAAIMNKTVFTDATGYAWTYGEIRQVAKNNNIAFTSRIVTSNDVVGGPESLTKAIFAPEKLKDKAVTLAQSPFKFGQDVVGRAVEEHSRLINFVSNLQKTGDVTLAAKRTKMFLFDYNNLTNFERTFLRRLIPFYTFSRKNIELQARALLSTPGRVAAEVHAIDTLGEVISGGQQLSDEERDALPQWIKSGVSILTKKNGDQINMIANLGTPLEQPFQQIQGNVLLGSISPLIRVPIEQAAGYSFFQGKPLSEATNAAAFKRAPDMIKDLIGYTEVTGTRSDGKPFTWSVSLRPELMNLILNLPPSSRVFSALKQMDAADVSEQAKIIQQLTGVRPYSFDLEQERQKRDKELRDKLENLLTKAGVTAKFETTYIPKASKTQFYNQ